MGLVYDVATLPASKLQGWELSPYGGESQSALGVIRFRRRLWRSRDGRAAFRLMSLNHPRVVKPSVGEFLASAVSDLVWAERLTVLDDVSYTQLVGEDSASVRRIRVYVPYPGAQVVPTGLIPSGLVGVNATIYSLSWQTGRGFLLSDRAWSEHFLIAVTDDDHADEVSKRLPGTILYE